MKFCIAYHNIYRYVSTVWIAIYLINPIRTIETTEHALLHYQKYSSSGAKLELIYRYGKKSLHRKRRNALLKFLNPTSLDQRSSLFARTHTLVDSSEAH